MKKNFSFLSFIFQLLIMEIVLNEYILTCLLGLVAVLTFFVMNFFRYSLTPKTYDDALAELQTNESRPNNEGSPRKKKSKGGETAPTRRISVNRQQQQAKAKAHAQAKAAGNLKPEHVIFADEISAEDEKFSPQTSIENIEGILHNKAEKAPINPKGDEIVLNAFEDTVPLDDLQLIRRKSLQLTPSSSQGNSKSGSRTDLANLNDNEDEDIDLSVEKPRTLKFSEVEEILKPKQQQQQQEPDVKQICKTLRKMDLSDSEVNQIVEIMAKKEEQNSWQGQPSILARLRREAEERKAEAVEANEVVASLQNKLKQMRTEFSDDRAAFLREKRVLEEANVTLTRKAATAEDNKNAAQELKKKMEQLEEELAKTKEKLDSDKLSSEVSELREKLASETKENSALNKSIAEQQGVIEMAMRRLFPDELAKDEDDDDASDPKVCEEHQKSFDKFVAEMKKKKGEGGTKKKTTT